MPALAETCPADRLLRPDSHAQAGSMLWSADLPVMAGDPGSMARAWDRHPHGIAVATRGDAVLPFEHVEWSFDAIGGEDDGCCGRGCQHCEQTSDCRYCPAGCLSLVHGRVAVALGGHRGALVGLCLCGRSAPFERKGVGSAGVCSVRLWSTRGLGAGDVSGRPCARLGVPSSSATCAGAT